MASEVSRCVRAGAVALGGAVVIVAGVPGLAVADSPSGKVPPGHAVDKAAKASPPDPTPKPSHKPKNPNSPNELPTPPVAPASAPAFAPTLAPAPGQGHESGPPATAAPPPPPPTWHPALSGSGNHQRPRQASVSSKPSHHVTVPAAPSAPRVSAPQRPGPKTVRPRPVAHQPHRVAAAPPTREASSVHVLGEKVINPSQALNREANGSTIDVSPLFAILLLGVLGLVARLIYASRRMTDTIGRIRWL